MAEYGVRKRGDQLGILPYQPPAHFNRKDKTEAEAETKPESKSGAVSESKSGAVSESKSGAVSESKIETKIKSKSEAGIISEMETGPKADLEAEPKDETKTKPKAEAKPKADLEAEPKAEAEIKTNTKPKTNNLKAIRMPGQAQQSGWIRQLLFFRWNLKNARKRAVRYFALFLLFMIVCTVVSRGIYAYQMPRVELGQVTSKNITHAMSIIGSVEAAAETAVVMDSGIRIHKVSVKAGEKVEKGTELLQLDTSDLESLIETIGKQINVMTERIRAIKSSNTAQQISADTARQRASEDLANTSRSQDAAVASAQEAYAKAAGELSAYPGFEKYLNEMHAKDSRYQSLKKAAEKKTAEKSDKRAFVSYAKESRLSAKTAWETGKRELEAAAEAQKSALDSAVREREDALLQARRNVSDAQQSVQTDFSSVMEAENDLTALRRQQKAYQKLLKRKGRIASGLDGYLKEVCVAAGDRTGDGAAFFLADGSEGWNFKALLTQEQAEQIKAGDTVTLEFQNGAVCEEDCIVSAVSKNAEGMYEAVVKTEERGLALGEAGILKITSQAEQYSCCVPLTALYTDQNKDYVLLIRETNTILGTELSAVKREVTVKDKSDSVAALNEDALGAEDLFIVHTSKAVAPGDKVRLLEEEDI
ncbi:MAG: hypothetical protein HFH29_04460 [Eubacterium sp.]|nr:hypothetical protein [Eubacterium sp.]